MKSLLIIISLVILSGCMTTEQYNNFSQGINSINAVTQQMNKTNNQSSLKVCTYYSWNNSVICI